MTTPTVETPDGVSISAQPALSEVRSAERFYLPQLDILRFFAFFAVFIGDSFPDRIEFYERLGAPHLLSVVIAAACTCGAFGVDLFFALSSYLITTLLLREMTVLGKVDTFAFYMRRALRIWPLYFVFLFGYFFLQSWIPHGRGLQPLTGPQLIPFALFLGNFEIMKQPMTQIAHLWSVSVEEQFYVTWALVLRWVKVARLPILALAAIVLSVGVRAYLQVTKAGFVAILCNTFTRLDPLALGVLVATGAIFATKLRRPQLWIVFSIAAVIATEILLPVENDALPNATLTYLIVAVACAMLVRATLDCRPGDGAIAKALVYAGKISFGLYVYCPIGLAFARQWIPGREPGAYLLRAATSLTLTFAAAVISYELMERRFLRLKQRFTYIPSRPA